MWVVSADNLHMFLCLCASQNGLTSVWPSGSHSSLCVGPSGWAWEPVALPTMHLQLKTGEKEKKIKCGKYIQFGFWSHTKLNIKWKEERQRLLWLRIIRHWWWNCHALIHPSILKVKGQTASLEYSLTFYICFFNCGNQAQNSKHILYTLI